MQWKKEFCFGRTTISISQSNDGNLLPSKYLEMRNKLQQYKARQDPSKLKNLQIRRSRSQVVWALAAWLIKKKGGGKGKKNDRYLKIKLVYIYIIERQEMQFAWRFLYIRSLTLELCMSWYTRLKIIYASDLDEFSKQNLRKRGIYSTKLYIIKLHKLCKPLVISITSY